MQLNEIMTIRVTEEMRKKLVSDARAENRSVSGQIVKILIDHYSKGEKNE